MLLLPARQPLAQSRSPQTCRRLCVSPGLTARGRQAGEPPAHLEGQLEPRQTCSSFSSVTNPPLLVSRRAGLGKPWGARGPLSCLHNIPGIWNDFRVKSWKWSCVCLQITKLLLFLQACLLKRHPVAVSWSRTGRAATLSAGWEVKLYPHDFWGDRKAPCELYTLTRNSNVLQPL